MQQLNNMDIAILVIVGISALIALGRGLVKEVLSIVGWVLAGAAVIYLLPVLNPFTLKYIESGWMAGIATAAFILIVFMIVWIYATAGVVGKFHIGNHVICQIIVVNHLKLPEFQLLTAGIAVRIAAAFNRRRIGHFAAGKNPGNEQKQHQNSQTVFHFY